MTPDELDAKLRSLQSRANRFKAAKERIRIYGNMSFGLHKLEYFATHGRAYPITGRRFADIHPENVPTMFDKPAQRAYYRWRYAVHEFTGVHSSIVEEQGMHRFYVGPEDHPIIWLPTRELAEAYAEKELAQHDIH